MSVKLKSLKINTRKLDSFYYWMFERHSIWHKRYVLKQPSPWTTDKVLRDSKFTNVYRELDRGTLWYMQRIYPHATKGWREDLGLSERNLIWCTVLYRLLNRVSTFEKVSIPHHIVWSETFSPVGDPWGVWAANKGTVTGGEYWIHSLQQMALKEPIFTSAHRTCPTHHEGENRLQVFWQSADFLRKYLPDLWEGIKRAHSMEEVFNLLRKIPNVGDFIAYEICCDFALVKFIPFSEDTWVNPGPGCRKGLELIFPGKHSREEYQQLIYKLRDEQEKHFKRLKYDFYAIAIKRLTLRSIEHSLCEFSKYSRGRTRVSFKPSEGEGNQYGQWPLRFPRTSP